MDVRICDLPEDIRQLAIIEANKRDNSAWRNNGEQAALVNAFRWASTPQGQPFWQRYHRGMSGSVQSGMYEEDDQIIK